MRACFLAALTALLTACAAPPPAPVDDYSIAAASPGPEQPPNSYTVRPGDTLYAIAFRFGVDVNSLAGWNGIDAPYTIYPGQRLVFESSGAAMTASVEPAPGDVVTRPLPEPSAPETTGTAQSGSSRAKPEPEPKAPAQAAGGGQTQAPPPPARHANPEPAPPRAPGKLRWQWPASGPVLSGYAAGDASRNGIDIGGKDGDPVVAAAGGTVVYSGSGLIGYGELIIVKHDDRLLSAYGHNRKRLVQEGDKVTSGQRIAEMGSTGAPRPMLHFEIRVEGKPVNPADYLPSR